MKIALLLAAAAVAAAQPPVIRKPVQPTHFLESIGRRGAILGTEDGTFEAWLNPIKILRDFRLSVYFDGSLEPVPLSDLAEQVEVSPGRATIIHSHAAFTIRQTWVAALDRPALLVLLDIDTDRPLRLRASFIPEMKPMWPASFGGQSSDFDDEIKAIVLTEGLRRFSPVIGCPLFSAHSEQIGHQLPGRTLLLEMQVTPGTKQVPVVIASSSEVYRTALANVAELIRESDDYYREFDRRTLNIETPDPTLNDAFHWAKFALEKGWTCNDGVGCGLIAGFARSGESERPGFAWYFGGDALMNSWSIVDYGDFDRARGTLEFLRNHQRSDGKMEHELTQSAALLDWSRYPYGYYHGDTTPLYIFSIARYVVRSGDLAFLKSSWSSIEKAYRFCLTDLDEDGLLSNRKSGAGAVETGALSGRVGNDVYLEGVWIAALESYVKLAKLAGESPADAAIRLEQARSALNQWFVGPKQTFAFARLTDGSMYPAQSGWQGFALAFAGLDAANAQKAAAHMSRAELTTPWGIRLFATDSPNYDPLSYNDGSVWPFVTGFSILGEYRQHQAAAALRLLHGIAAMNGLTGAGFIPEYLSGERAQALPHAVPHQLFSSSAVINPLVTGMLGLEGDELQHTLLVRPHIPQGWTVRFENYRVGGSTVSGAIAHTRGEARLDLKIAGDPLAVTFDPAFDAGTPDTHKTISLAPSSTVQARVELQEPAMPPPVLINPEPGARAPR